MKYIFFSSIILVLFSACSSISTVTTFAKNTQTAMVDVNELMADIPASCKRVHFYTQRLGKAQCKNQESIYDTYMEITTVLSAYGLQLEVLSSDELYEKSEEFDTLEGSLSENERLNEDDAKAIRSLSELLTASLTKNFRDDKISFYLYEADESVQRLLSTLSKAINRNYVFELNTELRQLKSYHNKLALIGKKQEFIAWEMYRSKLYAEEKLLNEKIILAKRVAKGLESIAKAHHKLTQSSDELTKKELQKYIKDFSKELKPVFKDMKKVYEG